MKLKSALLILISGLVVLGCSKKDKNNGAPAGPSGQGVDQAKVATFKYYKGGFFTAPPNPTWSNDMTISFTTTGFYVEGEHSDPLCTRGGPFTQEQTDELFALVSALKVKVKLASDPRTADAGVEYIELTSTTGETRKYHLLDLEVPVGELYALNPTPLHDYLQALEASLPTSCQ